MFLYKTILNKSIVACDQDAVSALTDYYFLIELNQNQVVFQKKILSDVEAFRCLQKKSGATQKPSQVLYKILSDTKGYKMHELKFGPTKKPYTFLPRVSQ